MLRGSGRQRYMTRRRDPNDQTVILPGTTVWTQYDGDKPYVDYTVDDEGVVTDTKAYELGIGQIDVVSGETSYFHTDQIGTTRLMTDGVGLPTAQATFSAFGEKITSTVDSRYQYAGGDGYESLSAIGSLLPANWMHVGHRTYDASLGRFLERDPIGIDGGLNTYAYVENNPVRYVDPLGFQHPPNRPPGPWSPVCPQCLKDLKSACSGLWYEIKRQAARNAARQAAQRKAIREAATKVLREAGAIASAGAKAAWPHVKKRVVDAVIGGAIYETIRSLWPW